MFHPDPVSEHRDAVHSDVERLCRRADMERVAHTEQLPNQVLCAAGGILVRGDMRGFGARLGGRAVASGPRARRMMEDGAIWALHCMTGVWRLRTFSCRYSASSVMRGS